MAVQICKCWPHGFIEAVLDQGSLFVGVLLIVLSFALPVFHRSPYIHHILLCVYTYTHRSCIYISLPFHTHVFIYKCLHTCIYIYIHISRRKIDTYLSVCHLYILYRVRDRLPVPGCSKLHTSLSISHHVRRGAYA